MNNTQLTPDDLELIWAQMLADFDHYASRSPSFDHFRDWLGWAGWSFHVEEGRRIDGFVTVEGAQVRVEVHRLDAQEVDPDLVAFSLKEVWTSLTTPQLALY